MVSKKKVLVVDDEIHIVHVVAIKLRNNGYDVISADNGSDAYQLACERTPDIIVTDLQMPNMTGLELIKKLADNEDTKNIPVILLTARDYSDEKQPDSPKIAQHLTKPFSPKELLKCIQNILYEKVMAPDA
ncbi:MAG: response regulator [Planctomycetes bacterium]|nr:response regulator [Planctomycetota bacterium]